MDMDKTLPDGDPVAAPRESPQQKSYWPLRIAILAGLVLLSKLSQQHVAPLLRSHLERGAVDGAAAEETEAAETAALYEYGSFPKANDPFSFLPCTNHTLPPALDDPSPKASWAKLYDPNPQHWSWGQAHDAGEKSTDDDDSIINENHDYPQPDPYYGRGIYLCGYLDVPLDYTNKSDPRIARLAVTKFQQSGLARADGSSRASAGHKSERTLVVEPGGPGGSGTSMAWRSSESVSKRLSDSKYDVLGWDPRGVNASLPAISCYPFDADRDHWALISGQYLESVAGSPRQQLELADAMNQATFAACKEMHGDIPRFLGTAFVARDLEEIRKAIGEDELTAYFVSYGTGIGQTYANMFPSGVGRMILDGTEYQRDHRQLAGFGLAALDNATDAWHDGFLGECVKAGPEHCALAKPSPDGSSEPVTLMYLEARMEALLQSIAKRPVPGYTKFSGPSLVTYSALVGTIYGALYNARSWPALAQMLQELEAGNSTLAAMMLERASWEYDPTAPPPLPGSDPRPSSDELTALVVCADGYDAPRPADGLDWWETLWANMTRTSWVSGNSRFFNVLPCQHFTDYWPHPAEVYRGDLDHELKHPVLLIAETYDPATPLRNGRRLLHEMGPNARLVAHHGYGHSSRDTSACTDAIAKRFILEGVVPEEPETQCFADEKPYLYDKGSKAAEADHEGEEKPSPARDPMQIWAEHLAELALLNPQLLPR